MMKMTYEEKTHVYGRIWILSALAVIFAYPIITCIAFDACGSDLLDSRFY